MANFHGKIIANVDRLNQLMDRNGLAAVVARSGKNFTYLAGFAYPGTLARRDGWIDNIEVYDGYAESPYSRMHGSADRITR